MVAVCPHCHFIQESDGARECEMCFGPLTPQNDEKKKPKAGDVIVIDSDDDDASAAKKKNTTKEEEEGFEDSEDSDSDDVEVIEDAEHEAQWERMRGPDAASPSPASRRVAERDDGSASRFADGSALARLRTPFDGLEDPDRTGRRGGGARDQHSIHDAEYNNIWESGIKVLDDAPDATRARAMLSRLKRECDPVLRKHGWRVQELHEWTSSKIHGCCWPNGQGGASIVLVLRVNGTKFGPLKSYRSVLNLMLHEMTHIEMCSNHHGPPFRALCNQLHREHADLVRRLLSTTTTTPGDDVLLPTGDDDDYEDIPCGGVRRRGWRSRTSGSRGVSGSSSSRAARSSGVTKIAPASKGGNVPKRPLLKGQKMLDGRTREGKRAKLDKVSRSAGALAAEAAARRLRAASHQPRPPPA